MEFLCLGRGQTAAGSQEGLTGPLGLGQQSPCIDGPGDSVNHASIGGQEVAGDVAAVLFQLAVDVDDGEVPDQFMCGDEVLFDVPSNYPV